jgi:hypothetical protein
MESNAVHAAKPRVRADDGSQFRALIVLSESYEWWAVCSKMIEL